MAGPHVFPAMGLFDAHKQQIPAMILFFPVVSGMNCPCFDVFFFPCRNIPPPSPRPPAVEHLRAAMFINFFFLPLFPPAPPADDNRQSFGGGGGGRVAVTVGSLLDDQHWHSVHIERFNRQVNLTVDSHTQHFHTKGEGQSLEVDYEVSACRD